MNGKRWAGIWVLVFGLVVLGGVHGLNGGILGGVSMNWMGGADWKGALGSGERNGVYPELLVGAFLEMGIGPDWIFRPEFQMISMRGRQRRAAGGGADRITVDARVMQIPLLIQWRYRSPWGYFYGILGPSFNFILSDIQTESTIEGVLEESAEPPYYGLVFGITGGLGYELPIPSLRLTADLRYHRSLSPIFQDRSLNFQSLAFLLGLAFPIPLD